MGHKQDVILNDIVFFPDMARSILYRNAIDFIKLERLYFDAMASGDTWEVKETLANALTVVTGKVDPHGYPSPTKEQYLKLPLDLAEDGNDFRRLYSGIPDIYSGNQLSLRRIHAHVCDALKYFEDRPVDISEYYTLINGREYKINANLIHDYLQKKAGHQLAPGAEFQVKRFEEVYTRMPCFYASEFDYDKQSNALKTLAYLLVQDDEQFSLLSAEQEEYIYFKAQVFHLHLNLQQVDDIHRILNSTIDEPPF